MATLSELLEKRKSRENEANNSSSNEGENYYSLSDLLEKRRTRKAYEAGRLGVMMSPMLDRVSKWRENAGKYYTDYATRYDVEEGSYVYRGDTEDYLNGVTAGRDDLNREAESIRRELEFYKPYVSEEYYNYLIGALDGSIKGDDGSVITFDTVVDNATRDHDFYSQFEDEGAYKGAYYNHKFSEEYAEIDSLEKARAAAIQLEDWIMSQSSNTVTGFSPSEEDMARRQYLTQLINYYETKDYDSDTAEAEIAKLEAELSGYGNWVERFGHKAEDAVLDAADRLAGGVSLPRQGDHIGSLEAEISEKKAQHGKKKKEQEDLLAYEGYEALRQNEDFADRSQYVSNFNDKDVYRIPGSPWYEFSDNIDAKYEYINRNSVVIDAWQRNDLEEEKTTATADWHWEEMTDDEVSMYNYLYSLDKEDGGTRADEYLDFVSNMDGGLRDRQAADFFEKHLKDNTAAEILFSIPAGLDSFTSGVKNIFTDEYVKPSSIAKIGQMAYEDLADDGLIPYYDFADGSWHTMTVLGSSGAQALYDIGSTTANMLPSILVSVAVEAALPTVGEGGVVFAGLTGKQIAAGAGTLTMGASAMGNAKQEMLSMGYSVEQATAYGVMVGASEAGLSYLLSGIPGLRGGDGVFSALGQKAITKVDNALAKAAIALGGDMLDEGLEEGIQTVLEGWFKEIATGVDFEDPSAEEILYSSLLGALTAAGFGGGKLAISGMVGGVKNYIKYNKTGKSYANMGGQNGIGALAAQGLGLNQDTAAYKQAQKMQAKLDAGKSASNYSVGKLLSSMSESQTVTAVQTRLSAHIENKNDVRKLSNTITDILFGREVSDKALSAVADNKYALNTLNDVLGAKLKSGATVSDVKAAVKSYQTATTSKSGANASTNAKQGSEVKNSGRAGATFSVQENADGRFDVIAEASGNSGSIASYETRNQAQAAAYGYTLGMGAEGLSGFVYISEGIADGADLGEVAIAYNAIYNQGKQGKALSAVKNMELLSPEQRQYAYNLGIMDKALDSARGKKEGAERLETEWENDEDKIVDTTVSNETISETETVEEDIPEGTTVLKTGERITPTEKLTKEQKDVVEASKRLGRDVVIADIKKGKNNIDGLWDGKTLYINPKPNSGNPMFVLLKHELTHFTQISKKYSAFSFAVTDSKAFSKWLRDKGFKNSQEYIAKIISDQKKVGKNWNNDEGRKKARREMVANFVGDVLFAEDGALERFVNALSPDHKRTFGEFIRDFIDWIKSKLGKIDEVTMLERKYAKLFKDAKKVESTGFFKSTESSYSVSPDLDSELDTVLNGTFDASKNEVYLGETSNFMTEIIGAEALSLYMPASKVYSALVSEKEYNKKPYYSKQDHYHDIGKADFIEILEKSETPIVAFAASSDESGNKRQNRIVLVTDKIIRDVESGKDGYAVVVEEVDTVARRGGKQLKANKSITVYPRLQLFNDIQLAIAQGRILNLTKKGEHLLAGRRGSNPQATIRKDVLEKNIAHFWANVKWEKQKNKIFSTKETEMPSAFQIALEKAGYFDQDGHSKYMQENRDLSQDGDDSSYSYTPTKSESFDELIKQYNEGLITEEEFKDRIVGRKSKDDPISVARMSEEAANTTPDIQRRQGKVKGDGERDTVISKGKASIFSEEFKKEVETDGFIQNYKTITNEETLKMAAEELDREGDEGVQNWLALDPVRASVVDIVKGFILLDRYRRLGNIEGQVRVAQKISEMGTAAGQSVQSFTILRRLDSAAMLAYSKKTLDDAFKTMAKGKTEAWVKKHADRFKLTDEDIEFIFNRTILATTLPDGRDKDILISQIAQRIQDKLPPERGQSAKALQRISMLLNPKTIIRNTVGNMSVAPVHWVSDWIGTATDIAASKIFKTGVRTTSAISNMKENAKAFGRGAYESYDDFRKKINTQMNLDRFDISTAPRKSFNEYGKARRIAQALNALDRLTSFALSVGDRPFYEYWFTRSINAQMSANKVDVPTAEMIEIATQEALQRTWQDDNGFTKFVSSLKRGMNTINIGGYGAGDVMVKFTKTPANIAKAIYDLSPLGFASAAKAAVNLNNAVKSGKGVAVAQKKFVKSFSNAAAGTMLYVIMVALFKAGLLTGGSDEDKDVAAFEKWVQGVPAYSVNLGGVWFSYEWMQPVGAVAAIVSDYMEARDAGTGPLDSIVLALKSGGNVFMEQSFLQSFQRLFSADSFWDGVWDMIANDPSAWIPQMLSQFANLFDDKRRVTYDKANPTESTLNAIKYKIPGLRNTLTEDVDVFGRDVPNSQSNVWDAFFNPANTYVDTSDAVTDHVYGLYKELGNKAMIPAKAPYTIQVDGKSIPLSAEERANYQRIMGGVSYNIISRLLESDLYKSYTPDEQQIVISAVYSYAKKLAQANYKAEYTYDMAKKDNIYLSRTEYNAMTDEEKQKAYHDGVMSEYAEILDIDEKGVIAYFESKGIKSAVLQATRKYDSPKATELINKAVETASIYGAEEKDIKSDIRSSMTTYWKVQYRLAVYQNNQEEIDRIEQVLIDTGLYGSSSETRKTLKKWLEE